MAGHKPTKGKQDKGAGRTAPKTPVDAAAEAAALAAAATEVATGILPEPSPLT